MMQLSRTYAIGGWQRLYPMASGGPNGDGIECVRQTPDGGYIMAGLIENISSSSKNRIVKVDDMGNIQWAYTYLNSTPTQSWATNIELAPGGGYFVEGRWFNQVTFKDEFYIQHIDANGNQIWVNFYPVANGPTKGCVTTDGGYVAIAYDYDPSTFVDSVVLIKVDPAGNTNFALKYAANDVGIVHSVIQTMNGEYMVEGFQNNKIFLCKFSNTGSYLWRQFYGVQAGQPENTGKVVENTDGTFTVVGNDAITFGNFDVYLFKTDANGTLLWEQHFGQTMAFGSDLDKTTDGGYIITGFKTYNTTPKIILIKTDGNGTQQWAKEYNGDGTGTYKAYSVRQANDGGYIVGGAKVTGFYTRKNMYLIKTDELGEIYSNTLQGYVYDDANNNCMPDSGEHKMNNSIIEIAGNQTFFTSTNSDGYYWVRVDTGNYQMIIHQNNINAYWNISACSNDTVQLSIPNQNTLIDTNFTYNAIAYCPLLNVEMSTPFLRRCFNSYYYMHYCNNGTAAANNAYIDVNFDNFLVLDTASISVSYTPLGNNSYRFNIGDVEIGECGNITLIVYVSCSATLGQTHCSSAQIFPISNCLLPAWTGAVIELNAACTNDSVQFTINNSGAAASSVLNYYVIQDTLIAITGNISLAAGQSTPITIPTPNGSTYTLVIQQEPGYPAVLGDSLLSVSIEGCGGNINTGIVTQFSNYDGSPFLDIDCRMNIGAYDPNDKQAFPLGFGPNNYITPFTTLDYLIRFQNTGTDTAFTVIIRDTIPNELDITSIVPGASSHAYTYFIHGENAQVIDFVFNNIQLPDSNVNEPASNGFVKFKIQQKANNPLGTVIENKAGIYFDFNEPVITNTTHHLLGEDFIGSNLVSIKPSKLSAPLLVKVFPNPSGDDVYFEVHSTHSENYQLELIDALGSQVMVRNLSNHKTTINKGSLPAGVYFYRIWDAQGNSTYGKLIIK
jgi:hypothetical protein